LGDVPSTVTIAGAIAAIARPFVCETMTAEMVGTGIVPSWDIATGSPC